ncbi:MAG: hypothetical protein LBE12_19290 [Planctomycetaceae bacterium]|nr:hypothetical protein [Planctomycetaceae bacterium]
MHNRRCSEAQPTDQNLLSFVKAPHEARLSAAAIIISPLQGFGKMGVFLLRRLRFASPPVMHFTPLAGLRAKNKNFTDILH